MFSKAFCKIENWAVRRKLLQTFLCGLLGKGDCWVSGEGCGCDRQQRGVRCFQVIGQVKEPEAYAYRRRMGVQIAKGRTVLINDCRIAIYRNTPVEPSIINFRHWNNLYLATGLISMKMSLLRGLSA